MPTRNYDRVLFWEAQILQRFRSDILAKQKEIETREFDMQDAVESAANELYKKDPVLAQKYLTDYTTDNANRVVGEWWNLADMLIVKYDDGYVNIPNTAQEVGYTKWWLESAGYQYGPIKYEKPAETRPMQSQVGLTDKINIE